MRINSTPVHIVLLAATIALWIVATATGWIEQPGYLGHVSMAAIVYAILSALEGARGPRAVVEHLVEETTVDLLEDAVERAEHEHDQQHDGEHREPASSG